MRIVQVNSHINLGGAARIALSIHQQLLKDGQDSYFIYGRGEGSEQVKNSYCIDRKVEVLYSALFSRIIGLNGWGNKIATKRLISFLERVKPDIIHIHTLHGYYLNIQMVFEYLNSKNIPCVWTFHDCHSFTGNCGYYFECNRWMNGCGKCKDIHGYPKSQFFDWTHYMWEKKRKLFTAGSNEKRILITPSIWLQKEVEKSFFKKYQCITIHNGIDVENTFYPRGKELCRTKYRYSSNEKIVLGIAIGYSDPRKGAKYIVQAAKDLAEDIKVILIGWEKKNDWLLEGTSNIVTLAPIGDMNVLAEYYSMADVFVLPSLAENYATVTLEAMACGTPVVGFDVGGIPEQLSNGKGIIVEAGNQQAFTEAIRRSFSDTNLLRGKELAEKIQKENSMERMTEQYLKVYEKMLGE